mgnify:FL=1
MGAVTPDRELPESGAPFAVRTTRRRGRMSAAKRTALIDLLPKWAMADPLEEPLTEGRLTASFGRSAPRLLDVGVGTGEATLDWARRHPDHDVLAVELHRPGLARMLQALDADGRANVRIVETDVIRLLDTLMDLPARPDDGEEPDEGDRPRIDGVRVLFPDPWPKARHRSRRLVDRAFVSLVADLLPVGGWFHVATDWDGYALQVAHALMDEPRLEILAPEQALTDLALARAEGSDAFGTSDVDGTRADDGAEGEPPPPPPLPWASPRPERPVTTYERRGVRAGRRVTDLVARRVG